MPIEGRGWEILIRRHRVQQAGRLARTVGTYQVYHEGVAVPELAGTTAEPPGPGDNKTENNGKRIEPGRYPLGTQGGGKYVTWNYLPSENEHRHPKPGIELRNTDKRSEIVIHPGFGFLRSVGCINLCMRLPNPQEPISHAGSRKRVIDLIEDMKTYLGEAFPGSNERPIPNAWAVVEGEP